MSKIYESSQSITDVDVQRVETPHQGFFQLRRYHYQFRRFNTELSRLLTRELFILPYPAVGILLYDPQQQKFALVEQLRFGIFVNPQEGRSTSPWILELVMGMCDDPTESYESAAMREAKEEADAVVKRIVPITSYYNSPGTTSEYTHLFCGEVDCTDLNGRICGLVEEGEDIKVAVFDVSDIPYMLSNNQVPNANTILALQWLLLNKDSLWI